MTIQKKLFRSLVQVIRCGHPSQVDVVVKSIREADPARDVMATVEESLEPFEVEGCGRIQSSEGHTDCSLQSPTPPVQALDQDDTLDSPCQEAAHLVMTTLFKILLAQIVRRLVICTNQNYV